MLQKTNYSKWSAKALRSKFRYNQSKIRFHQISSSLDNMFLQKVSKTISWLLGSSHALNKTLHFPPIHLHPSTIPQHHPDLGIGSIHLFSIIQHLHWDASLFLHIALQRSDFPLKPRESGRKWGRWACNVSKNTPRFNSDSEAVNSSNFSASWCFRKGMFRNFQG